MECRFWIIAGIGVVAGACAGQAEAAPAGQSPNGRALKQDGLVAKAFRADAAARAAYQRHFAMASDELEDFLSTLAPARLPQGGLFPVYAMDGGRPELRVLRRGAMVWADPMGRPTLDAAGRPLSLGPKAKSTVERKTPFLENADDAATQALVTPEGEAEAVEPADDPMAEIGQEPFVVVAQDARSYPLDGMDPDDSLGDFRNPSPPAVGGLEVTTVQQPLGVFSAGIGALGNVLAALGFGAAAGVAVGDITSGDPPVDPVPEPATVAALALGLGALAARRRR